MNNHNVYGQCQECEKDAIGWWDYTEEGPCMPLCEEHAAEYKNGNLED